MTLWFDTTDLWEWREPQLTGIQRVVATVLGFALRQRSDVRVFRFDRNLRRLVVLSPEELPESVRRYGGIGRSPSPAPIDGTRGGWSWLRGLRARPPRPAADLLPAASTAEPAIRTGDSILSLSLTWGYEGYWEALGAEKTGGARMVQLVHDIAPITQPQWLAAEWKEMATSWLDGVTRRADLILTVSRFQRREIEAYLDCTRLRSPPVRAIRLGDNPPLLAAGSPLSSTAGLDQAVGRPFVLCVSGFYPRKNHQALQLAWRGLVAVLGDSCPRLVLVGPSPTVAPELLAQILADPMIKSHVQVLHDVTDEALGRLYRACLFTVYPSFYEGWGLPVAESLGLGRYCIASSAGPLQEIGGELIDYVDPADPSTLLAALRRAIQDPAYVAAREAAIKASYRPHDWGDTASEILGHVSAAPTAWPAGSL